MRPTSHASGLTRRTTGLSPPHVELIKLLAQVAVTDYLKELEAADTDAPAERDEEAR